MNHRDELADQLPNASPDDVTDIHAMPLAIKSAD
jgi:hypothetical protein